MIVRHLFAPITNTRCVCHLGAVQCGHNLVLVVWLWCLLYTMPLCCTHHVWTVLDVEWHPHGFTLFTCLPLHQPLTQFFMIEKNDSQSLNNPGIVHCSNNSQTHSEGECEERKTHIEICHMSAVGSGIPFSRRTARSISMISDFCVVSFWSFSRSSSALSRSCTTVLKV